MLVSMTIIACLYINKVGKTVDMGKQKALATILELVDVYSSKRLLEESALSLQSRMAV